MFLIYMLSFVCAYFMQEALKSPLCDKVYVTHVEKQFPVDTYFPVQTFHDEGFKRIKYVIV